MLKFKNIYHWPRNKAWAIVKRSGDRSELLYFYMPKMDYIRKLYNNKDFIMLGICLDKLKERAIFYAKKNLGFAINKELFDITIDLLRFEGYEKYADNLIKNTTEEFFTPLVSEEKYKEYINHES